MKTFRRFTAMGIKHRADWQKSNSQQRGPCIFRRGQSALFLKQFDAELQ
jgi:hypothetical protein